MLIVLVSVTVRSDALAEFEPAILENAARSVADEPGCVRFDVSQREDDPTAWLFYEVYTDGAAFEAHRASPHYAKYALVADRVVTSKSISRYTSKNIPHRPREM
jgi:(4S)-4-hydroxy-5-phosphonooxypentane-2,3-dione isomerase